MKKIAKILRHPAVSASILGLAGALVGGGTVGSMSIDSEKVEDIRQSVEEQGRKIDMILRMHGVE